MVVFGMEDRRLYFVGPATMEVSASASEWDIIYLLDIVLVVSPWYSVALENALATCRIDNLSGPIGTAFAFDGVCD